MQCQFNLSQAEYNTWARIKNHSFDLEGEQLSFTQRLARENRWSISYAEQVLEEYRRFCLLAVIADHPVTPSIEVDQVWHLHLTYSHDYWEVFCPNVLMSKFHHGPTKGGSSEGKKYRNWYQNTLNSYSKVFGQPPAKIWPSVEARFKNAGDMIQVNKADVFIISKKLINTVVAILGLAAATTFIQSTAAATETDSSSSIIPILIAIIILVFIAVIAGLSHKSKNKDNSCGGAGSAGGCGSSSGGDGGSGCGGGCGGCGG